MSTRCWRRARRRGEPIFSLVTAAGRLFARLDVPARRAGLGRAGAVPAQRGARFVPALADTEIARCAPALGRSPPTGARCWAARPTPWSPRGHGRVGDLARAGLGAARGGPRAGAPAGDPAGARPGAIHVGGPPQVLPNVKPGWVGGQVESYRATNVDRRVHRPATSTLMLRDVSTSTEPRHAADGRRSRLTRCTPGSPPPERYRQRADEPATARRRAGARRRRPARARARRPGHAAVRRSTSTCRSAPPLRLLRLQHLRPGRGRAARRLRRRRAGRVDARRARARRRAAGGDRVRRWRDADAAPAEELVRLLAALPRAPGAEVTVEANPDSVDGRLPARAARGRRDPALARHAERRRPRARHARPQPHAGRGRGGGARRARGGLRARLARPHPRRARRARRGLGRDARRGGRGGRRPRERLPADRGAGDAHARAGAARRPPGAGRGPPGAPLPARRRGARRARARVVRDLQLGGVRGRALRAQRRLLALARLVGARARRALARRRRALVERAASRARYAERARAGRSPAAGRERLTPGSGRWSARCWGSGCARGWRSSRPRRQPRPRSPPTTCSTPVRWRAASPC